MDRLSKDGAVRPRGLRPGWLSGSLARGDAGKVGLVHISFARYRRLAGKSRTRPCPSFPYPVQLYRY